MPFRGSYIIVIAIVIELLLLLDFSEFVLCLQGGSEHRHSILRSIECLRSEVVIVISSLNFHCS